MELYCGLLVLVLLAFIRLGKNKIFIYTLLLVLCVIISFRGISVGTDTYGYSKAFKVLTSNPNTWDKYISFNPGFAYLCYLFKNYISSNPLDCWGLMGVFYVLSFYGLAQKHVKNVGVAVALFVLYGSFLLGFNIIRQCFALSVVMCVMLKVGIKPLSLRTKFLLLSLIVSVGYLFHSTMMIFAIVPFYHTRLIQWIMQKKILIIILIGSFVIFATGVMVEVVSSFLDTTGMEGKLISYMSRVESEGSGYSIMKMVLVTVFHSYTIWVSKNVKNIFLFLGTIGIVFLNIFGVIVIEFVRVYEALMVFGLIYYAQLLTNKEYVSQNIFYKPVLILYLLITYSNIILKNYGEITPYVFR